MRQNSHFSRPLFHFFRKIVYPVHVRVLAQQNGLVTQIVAALVRPQESHVAVTARADRLQNRVEIR